VVPHSVWQGLLTAAVVASQDGRRSPTEPILGSDRLSRPSPGDGQDVLASHMDSV